MLVTENIRSSDRLSTRRRSKNITDMKYALVLTLIFAAASAANTKVDKTALLSDLVEYKNLMPWEKIGEVLAEYYQQDREYYNLVLYIQSAEFATLLHTLEWIPEVQAYFDYLDSAGLYIYTYVNQINHILGLELVKPKVTKYEITGGLKGLVADLRQTIPFDKFSKFRDEKIKSSPAFAMLADRLAAPEFTRLARDIYVTESFQILLGNAKEAGIDVAVVKELICVFAGFEKCF